MTYESRISEQEKGTYARLATVRLSSYELAAARAQLLQAEAIADFVHGAWTVTSALARRAARAMARKVTALLDAFAESAFRASSRQRDSYLAQATDTADLERRIRSWHAGRFVPMSVTRP